MHFEMIFVLSKEMLKQVEHLDKKTSLILIENFVDEKTIERYRSPKRDDHLRLVFTGSLTQRKQPKLALLATRIVIDKGINTTLHMIGDGPLMNDLFAYAKYLEISNHVVFHGHITDPYHIVSKADIFIMPSMSEGISRAALEALFLGLPCLMRDVDGNSEIINENNGVLFNKNSQLEISVKLILELLDAKLGEKKSLLPDRFTQKNAKDKLLRLLG
tara:strand:- start:376 stop:1026 length:651 start_codon:yes stop_codon:yes gene_type:complete